jgi:hypothetical protein
VDEGTLALMALRGGIEESASKWATYPLTSQVPSAESARSGRPLLVRRNEVAERYPDLGAIADGTARSSACP